MSDPVPPTSPNPSEPTKEQLKGALKAFKKRLKLQQLDQDSRLGRNPATSGRTSSIVAINAPEQFPQEIWDELVKQGKLRRDRHGLYELLGE